MALLVSMPLAGCETANFRNPTTGAVAHCGPYDASWDSSAVLMQTCTNSYERQGFVRTN
jgi:hypothetical protein